MIDYTALLKKLTPDRDGEAHTHLRTGTVDAVNSDGTLDIMMSGGIIVPSVPKLASAYAPDGATVQMISFRGSLLVLGPSASGMAGPSQRVATTVITSPSGTFTTTATQVASVTAPLVAGSIYRVTFDGAFDTTVDGDMVRARIREDNISGNQLQARDTGEMDAAGLVTGLRMEVEYTAVSTGNKTFVATGERDAGTGNISMSADPTFPAYMYVDYVRDS
jgi:hypothetical protein